MELAGEREHSSELEQPLIREGSSIFPRIFLYALLLVRSWAKSNRDVAVLGSILFILMGPPVTPTPSPACLSYLKLTCSPHLLPMMCTAL